MRGVVLALERLRKRYPSGGGELVVLREASLALASGEVAALVAPSGTGKSTLLHLAGLLERPDGGVIRIEGREAGELADRDRTSLRRSRIGFVYQAHHLLAEFTARENVMLPQLAAGRTLREARARADALLATFGLEPRADHLPGKLSGGEQQRVAVARALANRPALLLADEPTGNLDAGTAAIVFEELLRVAREQGVAALVATHNPELAARMDRTISLRDGVLVSS